MHTIFDQNLYCLHRQAREKTSTKQRLLHEYLLPMLLFGSIGAIAWAVRGTNGWNGIEGTILPGMMWGLLWYYLCRRKGIEVGSLPIWLGWGIAIGGEWGYGQYVSWIQGNFPIESGIIDIPQWQGMVWFMMVGIAWGSTGGIVLGWALHPKVPPMQWAARILIPFAAFYFAYTIVDWFPQLVLPHYGMGIYEEPVWDQQGRTIYTNSQNFAVVLWWVAAMGVAIFQRDKATLVAGGVLGGLYGPGYLVSALWCYGYSWDVSYIDWWKMWELSSGLILGAYYVVVLSWVIRQTDKAHDADGTPIPQPEQPAPAYTINYILVAIATVATWGYLVYRIIIVHLMPLIEEGMMEGIKEVYLPALQLMLLIYIPFAVFWCFKLLDKSQAPEKMPLLKTGPFALKCWWQYRVTGVVAMACWGYVYLGYMFREEYYEMDAVRYLVIMLTPILILWDIVQTGKRKSWKYSDNIVCLDGYRKVGVGLAAFTLVFVLFRGSTSWMGVVFGLYKETDVHQYDWPVGRMILFAPLFIAIIVGTVYFVRAWIKNPNDPKQWKLLPHRIADLMMMIALVGAVSIWPAKIGVFYALFIALAIYAHNRINTRFDAIDGPITPSPEE